MDTQHIAAIVSVLLLFVGAVILISRGESPARAARDLLVSSFVVALALGAILAVLAAAGCAAPDGDPCYLPCEDALPVGAEWPCAEGLQCTWNVCAEQRGERPQICSVKPANWVNHYSSGSTGH